jgi:hypothetical protein
VQSPEFKAQSYWGKKEEEGGRGRRRRRRRGESDAVTQLCAWGRDAVPCRCPTPLEGGIFRISLDYFLHKINMSNRKGGWN